MAEGDNIQMGELKPKETIRSQLRRTIGKHYNRQGSDKASADKAAIQKFIGENAKHRRCVRYIKDKYKERDICFCGRMLQWHEDHGIIREPEPVATVDAARDKHDKPDGGKPVDETEEPVWSADDCTEKIDATSFGTIKFCGFDGEDDDQFKPYIRIDYKDDIDNLDMVWKLMYQYWNVPAPRLIISVTGGAKKFTLKSSLKRHFKRGLINAAATTGAWLVTGGTNEGVMGFVGEAVKEYKTTLSASSKPIVALGIATWGVIDNKEPLIGSSKYGQFPTYYNAKDLHKDKSGLTALDPNHTHFILVDDGTEGLFGKEIVFRTAFEQYMSRKMETGVAIKQSVNIPVVLLVCEGGPNTLKTAMSAIQRGTPIVVMEGSGRAADYIVRAMKDTRPNSDGEGTEFPDEFKETYLEYAAEVFDFENKNLEYKAQVLDKVINNLVALLRHRPMITIFTFDDSDSTNEIDQAILDALLTDNSDSSDNRGSSVCIPTARRSNLSTQLSISLAWNRCDIAAQKILTSTNLKTLKKDKDFLYDAMFTALVQERVDFVQLFMDSGVELKSFLTRERLHALYNTVVLENKSPSGSSDLIKHMLQQTRVQTTCYNRNRSIWDHVPYLLNHVGMIISQLLGGQHRNIYTDDKYVVNVHKHTVKDSEDKEKELTVEVVDGSKKEPLLSTEDQDTSVEEVVLFDSAAKHLFVWAVLLNRRELAHIFWRLTDNHIGGALIASALLKALAKNAENVETDLSEGIGEHADIFERHAVGVMSECYQKDKDLSHQLLVRNIEFWDNLTLFAVADTAGHMAFMGHSCSQTKLNKMWKGRIGVYTGIWKIILTLICPLWIFKIKFNVDHQLEREDKEDIKPVLNEDEFVPSAMGRKEKAVGDKLYSVNLCGKCTSTRSIGFITAILFFFRSPVVKFTMNVLSMVIFLLLFSYLVLVDLRPYGVDGWLSVPELVLWGWELTLILEEFRQIVNREAMSLPYKFLAYFSSIWNRFDQFINFCFLVSVVLRITLPEDQFVWARIGYCLTLVMFFLRFMHVFFVAKNIGPKVIMIRRMLTDLMFFVCIFAVFLLSYGIAAQALRFPNTNLSWSLLIDVVYQPYWQMYGELFLEQLEGDVGECTTNSTHYPDIPRCPQESSLVIFLFSIYMVMTNVLLLNLLIAMFSYTFEQVQENSEEVWKFFRYSLIHEYNDRPSLPPPLIILNHFFHMIKYVVNWCCEIPTRNTGFKVELSPELNKKLTIFERVGMENYVHNMRILYNGETTRRGGNKAENYATHEDIDEVYSSLSSLESKLQQQTEQMNEALTLLHKLTSKRKIGPLHF